MELVWSSQDDEVPGKEMDKVVSMHSYKKLYKTFRTKIQKAM